MYGISSVAQASRRQGEYGSIIPDMIGRELISTANPGYYSFTHPSQLQLRKNDDKDNNFMEDKRLSADKKSPLRREETGAEMRELRKYRKSSRKRF
jgi:hypothetical protein